MKTRTFYYWGIILTLLFGMLLTPTTSQALPSAGAISGTTTYSGSYDTNHEVLVSAHLNPDAEPVASVHILGPGAYTLEDLPDGTYYISAFLDIHDREEGPPEFGEPYGWYDANHDSNPDAVVVSGGNVSGIDIAIQDIDSEYIQGTVCYLGGVTGPGPLDVGLHTNPADPPVTSLRVSLPCDEYIFSGGPTGTYYISVFYDVNDSSGPPDPGEPLGWYDANGNGSPDPLIYTGEVITNVNITLGGIHYVDFSATGEDDGTSWADAFTDLQDALTAAQPGEEIWVASGTYFPGTTRDASFVLPKGVAVYGGFSGSENYRNQRNMRANLTVLSGEIGDSNTKADNAYHVVTTASTYENPLDASTVLDGFTITGGYANLEAGQAEKGGGFLNNYGSPTLVNLNFIDNYALNHGGALATQYNSIPLVVVNCTFSGNSATNNAGGIGNLSQIKVINSTFYGNSGGNGGGIVNLSGSQAEIYNSILWGNPGGEIMLQGDAVVTATYSIVQNGFAAGEHILTNDPLFADENGPDDVLGTLDDDLRLQAGSPALDAGDNTQLPADAADSNGNGNTAEALPWEFEGDVRTLDNPAPDSGNGTAPIVDIGADERTGLADISGLSIASAPSAPLLGETVQFAARALNGTQVSYAWDFGDGDLEDGPLPTHRY
ncbi:MAG: PKD domain-containing protein, partial [Anaerolineales bacterium]